MGSLLSSDRKSFQINHICPMTMVTKRGSTDDIYCLSLRDYIHSNIMTLEYGPFCARLSNNLHTYISERFHIHHNNAVESEWCRKYNIKGLDFLRQSDVRFIRITNDGRIYLIMSDHHIYVLIPNHSRAQIMSLKSSSTLRKELQFFSTLRKELQLNYYHYNDINRNDPEKFSNDDDQVLRDLEFKRLIDPIPICALVCSSDGKKAYASFGKETHSKSGCLGSIDLISGIACGFQTKFHDTIASIIWDTSTLIPETVLWVTYGAGANGPFRLGRIYLPWTVEQIWKYILIQDRILHIPLFNNLWSIIAEYLPFYFETDLYTSSIDSVLFANPKYEGLRSITGLVTLPCGNLLLGCVSLTTTNTPSILILFDPQNDTCKQNVTSRRHTSRPQTKMSNFVWDNPNQTLLFSDNHDLFSIRLDIKNF